MYIAKNAMDKLIEKNMTISFAESCTGGLLTKYMTDIPGSSAVLEGGVCAYSNEVKKAILGVSESALETYGAVSGSVALQMARGTRLLMKTDIGVGTTGIAGPDSDNTKKPVGLVYAALALPGGRYILRELRLSGDRENIRETAVREVFSLIAEYLEHA